MRIVNTIPLVVDAARNESTKAFFVSRPVSPATNKTPATPIPEASAGVTIQP